MLLAGGGLGNAVLFSIAKALKAKGDNVVYFAAYKNGSDLFKQDEIEVATDQVIWCTDTGVEIAPRRLVFEAPRKEQQVWFLKRFGPNVNLGNIPPADVLSLETLRLGLRSDTMSPGT